MSLFIAASADSSRLEMEGNITRAAAYAMFTGNTSEAISALRNSEDDRLKLLAPTLASYLSQQRRATNSPADTSMFKEICTSVQLHIADTDVLVRRKSEYRAGRCLPSSYIRFLIKFIMARCTGRGSYGLSRSAERRFEVLER